MADFEENVEEMVKMTWRSSGGGDRVWRRRDGDETEDETRGETGGPGDETCDEMAATAGDETVATGGVMYTDEVRI